MGNLYFFFCFVLYLLNLTESFKLILPVARYGELVLQVEQLFEHNQRLLFLLLGWRDRRRKILKTSLRFPEGLFIPEEVTGFIRSFLVPFLWIGNFSLAVPLPNGVRLVIRTQDLSNVNLPSQLCAIQIGIRNETGTYLLFRARFK